jgi:hypothetical protein
MNDVMTKDKRETEKQRDRGTEGQREREREEGVSEDIRERYQTN